MAGSGLRTLYFYELKMLVRDGRTLLVSVLVMPLFFYASVLGRRAMEERQAEETYTYALTGPESARVRELLAATEEEAAVDGAEEEHGLTLTLVETESGDPGADFADETLHFFVETSSAAVGELDSPVAEEAALPGLRLVYRGNWDASRTAAWEMEDRLLAGREARRQALLVEHGLAVPVAEIAALESRDLATAEQRTGAVVGRFATLVVLMLLIFGGSVVAAESIAGEKERGTLETLLTTALSRNELVVAKQLVILTVGVVITVIQLLNLLVYVGLGVIEVPAGFAVDFSPGKLLLFLPLAALVASLLLLASGMARTYKEFQVFFLPILLLLLVPAAAAALPGILLRSAVVLVPIANVSVAVREVLIGELDPLMLALAWGISAAAAVLAVRQTLVVLGTERLITAAELGRGELEGGPALFPRRVLRWFAVMWVLIFLVPSSLPFFQNLHVQLLFNLVVVMLGGSLLMIRRYRLDAREALALRPVKPVVWLAVVLGAPSLYLAAVGLSRLSLALFPVPERCSKR